MPLVLNATGSLSILVEAIDWEPIDEARQTFTLPMVRVEGPWEFTVSY